MTDEGQCEYTSRDGEGRKLECGFFQGHAPPHSYDIVGQIERLEQILINNESLIAQFLPAYAELWAFCETLGAWYLEKADGEEEQEALWKALVDRRNAVFAQLQDMTSSGLESVDSTLAEALRHVDDRLDPDTNQA